MEGTITRIVDYGAFAELEPGIEGLLHLSQISRSMVENASEVISVNETHLLRVVSIDPQRQRIGLSLKAVTANEQIEWMAQREVESQNAATEEILKAEPDESIDSEEDIESPVVSEAVEETADETTETPEAETAEEAGTDVVAEVTTADGEVDLDVVKSAEAAITDHVVQSESGEEE